VTRVKRTGRTLDGAAALSAGISPDSSAKSSYAVKSPSCAFNSRYDFSPPLLLIININCLRVLGIERFETCLNRLIKIRPAIRPVIRPAIRPTIRPAIRPIIRPCHSPCYSPCLRFKGIRPQPDRRIPCNAACSFSSCSRSFSWCACLVVSLSSSRSFRSWCSQLNSRPYLKRMRPIYSSIG
jgi:hypothetical protein